MKKKLLVVFIVVLLSIAGGLSFAIYQTGAIKFGQVDSPVPTQVMLHDTANDPIDQNTKDTQIKAQGVQMGGIKSGIIEASNFKFTPDAMGVNLGDTVTVTFKNTGGMHNFVIDEFNVKSKTLKSGESEEITFVANKKGTFQYYCSTGQHRAMGMVGTIVVQ